MFLLELSGYLLRAGCSYAGLALNWLTWIWLSMTTVQWLFCHDKKKEEHRFQKLHCWIAPDLMCSSHCLSFLGLTADGAVVNYAVRDTCQGTRLHRWKFQLNPTMLMLVSGAKWSLGTHCSWPCPSATTVKHHIDHCWSGLQPPWPRKILSGQSFFFFHCTM